MRQNFVALLVGDATAKLLRFVAAVALARALTLENFGLVNTAIAVSGVAAVFTTLGLADVGARDVAVAPGETSAVASRVVTGRLTSALAVLAVAVGIVLVADPSFLGVALAGGAMALGMAASADWVLRGREQMGALAAAWITAAATVAAGSLAIALAGGGAVIALCVFAVGEIVLAAATWAAVGRHGWPKLSFRGSWVMIGRSWPVGVASLIVYGYYANIDTIILAVTRSPAEAGLYSAPYRIFLMLNVVAVFAAYAVFPALSRASELGHSSEARALLMTMLELLLVYGLFAVGCVHLFGGDVLGLVFGARFESMDTTFSLLSLAVAWYAIGYPAGYSLIADGRNKSFLAGAATGGVVNLTLNLVLIPPYGPSGAGVSTVIAFAAASVVWLHSRSLLKGAGWTMLAGLAALSGAVALGGVTESPRVVGIAAILAAAAGVGLVVRKRRAHS